MSIGAFRGEQPIRKWVAGIKVVGPSGAASCLVPSGIFVDSVSIKAHPQNTDIVYIGPSGGEVYPLMANHSIDCDMLDLQQISVSGTLAVNQRLSYIGGRI